MPDEPAAHDRHQYASHFLISRRAFLGRVATLSVAARLDARSLFSTTRPRVIVVGAGAFGGWTALQLRERGAHVTLIDAWGPGNARSSSGGESRVIRAIYGTDRVYVEMVKRSWELWDKLDASTDQHLYTATGALWMHRGDDAYVRSAVPILADLGFVVEKVEVAEAVRRYPQIRFDGIRSAWLEKRAGTLSARRACLAVRDSFERAGGVYRTAHVEPGPITAGSMSTLRVGGGAGIQADVYVFACGPWLGRIFPDLIGDAIRPTRQEVHYFGAPPGSDRYQPGRLPVWIDFGERIVYGVPDVDGHGFKIADDTRGDAFDPTAGNRLPSEESIVRARRLLAERFPELANAPLLKSEVCQYENSPDGHLVIGRHPNAKNVWIAGGGSGHGFKLAPAVGEIVASAILAGKEVPKLFGLDRLRDAAKPTTQFET